MQTDEIVKLTHKRVTALIKARHEAAARAQAVPEGSDHDGPERRRAARWPFKGAVEMWPAGGDGRVVTHATCLNISETGMGASCDEPLEPGSILDVAIHLPEMTLCGRAAVRYCAPVRSQFNVGMEFLF
jgi:hypothetical protein